MKKILVIIIATIVAIVPVANAQQGSQKSPGVTIYSADGTKSDIGIGGSPSKTCVRLCKCSRHTVTVKKVVGPTYTWTSPQGTPCAPANTVVVVQQVVSQPTYVVQPRCTETPGRVWGMTFPFVASAGIGISTYPSSYYSETYWQHDSRYQERYNMAATRYGYDSRRSGGQSFNNNPYGSRPSVGDMYGHSGRRR
ncbi:MAG: hypothetical protein RLY66_88 [Candidatus Parcubacteria bacterium]|jgi:hypothetical protein